MRPASSNHIFCIARNTGQPHQKKHDLTMRAKIKTDTVYATVPRLEALLNHEPLEELLSVRPCLFVQDPLFDQLSVFPDQ
jgi:hypothetical protein